MYIYYHRWVCCFERKIHERAKGLSFNCASKVDVISVQVHLTKDHGNVCTLMQHSVLALHLPFLPATNKRNVHLDDMSDFILNTLKTFFSFRTCLPRGLSMGPHAQMNTLKPSVWLKHLQEKKQSALFDSVNGLNFRANIDRQTNCNRNLEAKMNEMDWLHNDYTPLYELTPMESVVQPSTRKGSFPYRTKLLHCNSEPQASGSEHHFNADHNGLDI